MNFKVVTKRVRARLKSIVRAAFVVGGLLVIASLGINVYIIWSTKDSVCKDIAFLPEREIELVLGTEPVRPDGSLNLHFLNRTDAAAKVYLAGKARTILISGNKNNRGFNEVLEMKSKLLAEDVPEAALKLDFDGIRTWESIQRAKEIYHVQRIILITDAFHAPRSIFLCKHFGIDAIAFCPIGRQTLGYWAVRYNVKEYFARLKAVVDILSPKNQKNG